VVIRKGVWKRAGTATLYGPDGGSIISIEFPTENALWREAYLHARHRFHESDKSGRLSSPPSLHCCRQREGEGFITWDVVTPKPRPPFSACLTSRDCIRSLPVFTPCLLVMGKRLVEVVGEGEGFKKVSTIRPLVHLGPCRWKFFGGITPKVPLRLLNEPC
jgi:hypothetical protein